MVASDKNASDFHGICFYIIIYWLKCIEIVKCHFCKIYSVPFFWLNLLAVGRNLLWTNYSVLIATRESCFFVCGPLWWNCLLSFAVCLIHMNTSSAYVRSISCEPQTKFDVILAFFSLQGKPYCYCILFENHGLLLCCHYVKNILAGASWLNKFSNWCQSCPPLLSLCSCGIVAAEDHLHCIRKHSLCPLVQRIIEAGFRGFSKKLVLRFQDQFLLVVWTTDHGKMPLAFGYWLKCTNLLLPHFKSVIDTSWMLPTLITKCNLCLITYIIILAYELDFLVWKTYI